MNTKRSITLSLVTALAVLSPASALARNGADDDPALGDDRGGTQVATTTSTDDNPSAADDNGGSRTSSKAERRVAGSCTASSTSKLKLKLRDGRWETEFEVDQNRVGVRWNVRLSHGGKLAVATTKTTRAPSGSFSLERKLRNSAGDDTISARATSPGGEVCSASVTI
jgi:hypothetical protein